MKGLLLKDFYMIIKHCKSYLFIMALFIAMIFLNDNSFFFIYYLCLIGGLIPITLLGYDERSKWDKYCGTLPYSKTQIVSAKYLMGLFSQIIMVIITGIAQTIKMNMNNTFDLKDILIMMTTVLAMAATSSITLPFLFKYGVEKGRIAYYIMIGILFGTSTLVTLQADIFIAVSKEIPTTIPLLETVSIVLCIFAIAIYALSWFLSIVFYKKREIS